MGINVTVRPFPVELCADVCVLDFACSLGRGGTLGFKVQSRGGVGSKMKEDTGCVLCSRQGEDDDRTHSSKQLSSFLISSNEEEVETSYGGLVVKKRVETDQE